MTDKTMLEAAQIIADAILELARSVDNAAPYPEVKVKIDDFDDSLISLGETANNLDRIVDRLDKVVEAIDFIGDQI